MNSCLCGKLSDCKSEIKRIYGESSSYTTPSYAPPVIFREATSNVSSDGWRYSAYLRPQPADDTFRTPVPNVEDLRRSVPTSPTPQYTPAYNLCQKGSCTGGVCGKSPSSDRVTPIWSPPRSGYSLPNYFDVERKLKAEAASRKAASYSTTVSPGSSTDSMEQLLAMQRQQLIRLGDSISELEGITRRAGCTH